MTARPKVGETLPELVIPITATRIFLLVSPMAKVSLPEAAT